MIAAVSTESLKQVKKYSYSRIDHIIRVNGRQIDQHNIWISHFEYLSYNIYWSPQMMGTTLFQRFLKPIKDIFAYPLYYDNCLLYSAYYTVENLREKL